MDTYKRMTVRLNKKSYLRIKDIHKILNRNPINPYISLNRIINTELENKYPKALLTRLKKSMISNTQYEYLKKYYNNVTILLEKSQELISNIANNCNQVARRLNTIHDENKSEHKNKKIDEKHLHKIQKNNTVLEHLLVKVWTNWIMAQRAKRARK